MLKVIFVDDEPFIMQGLSMIIDWEASGYEIVGMAGNAKEALDLIEQKDPELVIADVHMPEMSGLELLENVHQKKKDISFIMLSGFSDFGYVRKALMEGCIDYLLKPVNRQDLLAALEKVHDIRKEQNELKKWTDTISKTPLFHFFNQFNPKESITDMEANSWNSNEASDSKKLSDELVHAVETNNKEEIMDKSKALHWMLTQADDLFVNMELNYIIYELLHLAITVDDSIDQQEVLQFISDSVLDNQEKEKEESNLQKVMLDYGEYLCELRGNQSIGMMGEIENYMKKHYAENITLKDLGKRFFVNSAYLGQIFKKQFGESFKDYLNGLRIQKAEELLIYSDMKIYEIAAEIGYKDIDYFINKFITVKGCTPAKFRKQMK